ncbi:MAG: rhodanese-like domain-containing protein [Mariprofundales bacterium]|nr:rhodanese-like domain-containing protein [Mariprofundales bacterium]
MVMLSVLPLLATACGVGEQTADGYESVSVQHAHEHWQQGEQATIPFVMLDVRTQQEYDQGHIKGAVLIPVQSLSERIDEVPKDRQLYLYCRSGVRSARASRLLAQQGFTSVENVIGGIEAWRDAGYPVESR